MRDSAISSADGVSTKMTDFELVIAFTDVVATGHSLIGNYLTVVFAFLVTSYLAADKLSALIAYIVLGLFSLIAVGMIMEIWTIDHDTRSSHVSLVPAMKSGAPGVADGNSKREDEA